MVSYRRHRDPVFTSAIPEQSKEECEEGVAGYTSTRTLLMDYTKKPKYLKYGCYRAILDTWVRRIAAATHLERPFDHKPLILKTAGDL